MTDLIADCIDALIPLGVSLLILVRPQALTKKDLSLEENAPLAKQLKTSGFILLGAGTLILIANLASR